MQVHAIRFRTLFYLLFTDLFPPDPGEKTENICKVGPTNYYIHPKHP